MTLQTVEEYNRNHALSQLNRSVSVFVWLSGFGALVSSIVQVTLPWLGSLSEGLERNHAINNFIVQGGLLLLFVNTNNVYDYYVVKLRYSLACALTGSAVYLAHLLAVVVCFRNPSLLLWCVSSILALRTVANLQLCRFVAKNDPEHPWKATLGQWRKHSFIYLCFVLVCALLVQICSDLRFYSWVHGIALEGLETSPIANLLVADIRTLLLLAVAVQIGTFAFQRVSVSPKFTRKEIDEQHENLRAYHNNSSKTI